MAKSPKPKAKTTREQARQEVPHVDLSSYGDLPNELIEADLRKKGWTEEEISAEIILRLNRLKVKHKLVQLAREQRLDELVTIFLKLPQERLATDYATALCYMAQNFEKLAPDVERGRNTATSASKGGNSKKGKVYKNKELVELTPEDRRLIAMEVKDRIDEGQTEWGAAVSVAKKHGGKFAPKTAQRYYQDEYKSHPPKRKLVFEFPASNAGKPRKKK